MYKTRTVKRKSLLGQQMKLKTKKEKNVGTDRDERKIRERK